MRLRELLTWPLPSVNEKQSPSTKRGLIGLLLRMSLSRRSPVVGRGWRAAHSPMQTTANRQHRRLVRTFEVSFHDPALLGMGWGASFE